MFGDVFNTTTSLVLLQYNIVQHSRWLFFEKKRKIRLIYILRVLDASKTKNIEKSPRPSHSCFQIFFAHIDIDIDIDIE